MVLGSWAVPQMQAGGPNADDIAYMPFPISVDGKQYASASADYCYGVNVNSTSEEKTAHRVLRLCENSGRYPDRKGRCVSGFSGKLSEYHAGDR